MISYLHGDVHSDNDVQCLEQMVSTVITLEKSPVAGKQLCSITHLRRSGKILHKVCALKVSTFKAVIINSCCFRKKYSILQKIFPYLLQNIYHQLITCNMLVFMNMLRTVYSVRSRLRLLEVNTLRCYVLRVPMNSDSFKNPQIDCFVATNHYQRSDLKALHV